MTRWLQAATAAPCQTDTTDRTDKTPAAQDIPTEKTPASEVLSVLSVCQFGEEPNAADPEIIPWPVRCYAPESISAGVADAFTDWEAMNDPFDARAWA